MPNPIMMKAQAKKQARLMLLAVAALFAGYAMASELISLNESQIKALGIEVALPQTAGNAGQVGLPGRIVVPNDQMRVVAAPVAGMVEMLAVAPGSTVKRGQVLARLASPQALELQSGALQATSQAHLARQNLKRDERLFAEGLIAESRLQASRAAAAQASAQASERNQGLALTGGVPGKVGGPLALLSPIDGTVLEQGASVGQRVDASALIYRIAKLSPLWLELQAPMSVATEVKVGTPVRVPGTPAKGKVIAIGRAVDPGTQSVLLRAAIAGDIEMLRAGQVVQAELDLPAAGGYGLPSASLVRHAGKTLVFIQTGKDSRGNVLFQPQVVRPLGHSGDQVLIEGLSPDAPVAVKGTSGLKALWTGMGKE